MTEQQPYDLVQQYPHFELRRYPAHVLAEVEVHAAFDRAGNEAFRYLFNYISGSNTTRQKLTMTAPVIQESGTSEKLAVTAPVLQSGPLPDGRDGDYAVAFVLPAGLTAETAPVPKEPKVKIREVPGALSAVARFTGNGSAAAFERHTVALTGALQLADLTPISAPRFARFDPPFKPWFLRHNEVLLDVKES
ncbi:heme-binding protein [Paenarthrobacter sp. CM16]|uniref:SOUL family heme-binding protein n=1 Tax=Paenarthrobacter sp. CM16 TaxID=2738447 RepID=UPI001554A0F5|nr:heme-binding protein [Paenarthrobacter sp. CM16]NQD90965.1 heme-binding protein [Paenarthrobacter sp. CM16]